MTGTGDNRARIEHVIVLMMENRSFDHLLGYLDHPDTKHYPRLTDQDCPVDPADPGSARVPVNDHGCPRLGTDPDHSHAAAMFQIYGQAGATTSGEPRMNGFVKSYADKIAREGSDRARPAVAADIMNCFSAEHIPALSALATEFAVFTRWHASVPGETWPNRNFVHAGTSDGEVGNRRKFYGNRTIFELLAASSADRTWRIYHDGVPQTWVFPKLWLNGRRGGFSSIGTLLSHIGSGRLPTYSFVEPHHGIGGPGRPSSQHPGDNTDSGAGFARGEALIRDIYNALVTARNGTFEKTLFLVTYDEHGGFYDRAHPLKVAAPDKKSTAGFRFDLSGVRVPCVAVSPLIPRGHIVTRPFDHSSVPAMLRNLFASDQQHLGARVAAANDPLDVLPLLAVARSDCGELRAPRDLGPTESWPPKARELTDFEDSLVELAAAVKTELDTPTPPGHTLSPDSTPPWNPDETIQRAVFDGEFDPASEGSQEIDGLVDRMRTDE